MICDWNHQQTCGIQLKSPVHLVYDWNHFFRADALLQSWMEKSQKMITRSIAEKYIPISLSTEVSGREEILPQDPFEKNLPQSLSASVLEPPVGAVRARTVVNAAEDSQRKKPKTKCALLTTAGAPED